jgi:hypothetical protein
MRAPAVAAGGRLVEQQLRPQHPGARQLKIARRQSIDALLFHAAPAWITLCFSNTR